MTDTAWQVLRGLVAWQVGDIPRLPLARARDGGPEEGDWLAAQRLQALVSAFHHGSPLALGWLRARAGGPVQVIAAGQALMGGADGGQVLLTLPAGARGDPLPADGAGAALAQLPCWIRLGGIIEPLAAGIGGPALTGRDQAPRRDQEARPSLEDGLLTAWSGPFGWVVLAEPVSPESLDALTDDVSLAQLRAQQRDDPQSTIAAQRLEARHAELRQAAATGLWRVHLLAGGESPQAAAQLAGLLCASVDLDGLPYVLAPVPGDGSLDKLLDVPSSAAADSPADGGPGLRGQDLPGLRAPFYSSSRMLAAVARPPSREVPGVRFVLRPEFDVTPESIEPVGAPSGTAAAPVPLGIVLDGNRMPAGTLAVPRSSLNRHTFVCGATGAGKSQTVRALLEAATAAGLPWLVVEPAKAEYAAGMAARLPGAEVVRIRPGSADEVAAGISPLEPAPGPGGVRYPLQTHADLVRALFLAAFEPYEPFPQVIAAALTRCYEQAGWDLALGEPMVDGGTPAYPSLGDLQRAAEQVVAEIGYGPDISKDVGGFIKVRLSSLRLGTTGRFFEGGHPLDFAALLERNVVLEIEDVGDDKDKAFLMGMVVVRLAEHLRLHQRQAGPAAPGLRHLTVIEEAHRLLRSAQPGVGQGTAVHAVEMFADLLAEIRAYGEGLIVAEQIPAKLIDDVIKNTAVKVVHRLPAADDRDAVGATMNLTDDQSQYLVTLTPGEAAVFTDGMDYPVLVRMPDGTPREAGPPAELASPARIVAPRSATCGRDCQEVPCTLRDMRAAQRVLRAHPVITLWAEYSVLGHLTAWHMPLPAQELESLMAGLPRRERDCAISHAVDAAVAARVAVISSRVSPAALAGHVTAAIRATIDERSLLCALPSKETVWLAPCYRWAVVLEKLQELHAQNPDAPRHPDSGSWEQTYGRPIPGPTCAAQLHTVSRWYKNDTRDTRECWQVVLGSQEPPALELAVGARRGDPDWNQRLADGLEWFEDVHFPLIYLATSPPDGETPPSEGKS
ncbi:MAG TPA: ATP-binding protein [Streptosporangiaceae bacterium]|jgi:DNA helicase HerA-like ATPase